MTAGVAPSDGTRPNQSIPQKTERPIDRVSQFARRTMQATTDAANKAKPVAIEAGRATVKVGGIFAMISAIFIAIFTLLCAVLFG